MTEHGHQPLTVINKHGIAIKKVITATTNNAFCRRLNRGAAGRSDIHTTVRFPGLTIEYAAATEQATDFPFQRPDKIKRHLITVGPVLQCSIDSFSFAVNPFHIVLIRIDLALVFDGDVLGRILLIFNSKDQRFLLFILPHCDFMGTRSGIEWDADNGLPKTVFSNNHNRFILKAGHWP